MSIKKLFATSLIASVAVASVEAGDSCVNGGFYVQGGFGLSMTNMKYKNNLKPQFNVLIAEEVAKMWPFNVTHNGTTTKLYLKSDFARGTATMDATKTSFNKRKNLFACQFGFGFDKRIHSVMIGVNFDFGKNFGKVSKKEKGLALTTYTPFQSLASEMIDDITGANGALIPANAYVNDPAQAPAGNAESGYDHDPALQGDNATDCYKYNDIDNAVKYQRDLELELKCKNKYYISIMPRIGVLVNPRLELYVTAGVKIKSDKYTLTAVAAKKSAKKTVTKCIPSFGLGLQYNFQNGMFTNLSYTFNLKAKKTFKFKANNKLNLNSTVKHTLQNSSHDVKWGIGYRF